MRPVVAREIYAGNVVPFEEIAVAPGITSAKVKIEHVGHVSRVGTLGFLIVADIVELVR